MQAQVAARRAQAAREAEAERQRQAAIAEQQRQEEAARQQAAADRANGWGQAFSMLGALAGGVAAGMQTGGDMTAISGGMAVGSMVGGQNDISNAAQQNFETERQRYEYEQAQQRELERRTLAAMNDPNNPLTQQQRREQGERDRRRDERRAEQDRADREAQEQAEADALLRERQAEARTQQEADDRARQQAERDQAAEERRRQQRERQEREERLAREEQAQREADERARQIEERRLAQEREREAERQRLAAAEAERNRPIEFREGVTLCSLSGPQAQFNNWTCEGPLQMNYVNFEKPNAAAMMALTGCTNYRELSRAGVYRAFGCGYGVHPTSPGALRNVPEMLGVFVDGRATFRCNRNADTCRTR